MAEVTTAKSMPRKTLEHGLPFLALLVLFSGTAGVLCIADRTPVHLGSRFPGVRMQDEFMLYQNGVIQKTLPGPYVYRVLVPYTVNVVQSAIPGMSAMTIDLILKFSVLLLCQFVFYKFLSLFFGGKESVAGVLWWDLLVGYSLAYVQGPSVLESIDLVNALVFMLACLAIYHNQILSLTLLLAVGTLNRESTLLLLSPILIDDFRRRRSLVRTLVSASAVAIPYLGIRLPAGSFQDWWTWEEIPRNIPFLSAELTGKALVATVHVLLLIGPLLFLALHRFREQPTFLKIVASSAPLIIMTNYLFGAVIESRVWLPLYVVLIPLALGTLARIFERPTSNAQ